MATCFFNIASCQAVSAWASAPCATLSLVTVKLVVACLIAVVIVVGYYYRARHKVMWCCLALFALVDGKWSSDALDGVMLGFVLIHFYVHFVAFQNGRLCLRDHFLRIELSIFVACGVAFFMRLAGVGGPSYIVHSTLLNAAPHCWKFITKEQCGPKGWIPVLL
jgi:hypothetical protein